MVERVENEEANEWNQTNYSPKLCPLGEVKPYSCSTSRRFKEGNRVPDLQHVAEIHHTSCGIDNVPLFSLLLLVDSVFQSLVMLSTTAIPHIICGNRFRSRLPSSLLSLEEAQKRDLQWREYFYVNECSAEDRYCDVESLSEYGLIRDFVLQENAMNIDAFTKWGNRFSRWLAENREFTLGLKPKQYLKQQYPFVNMKELLWMLSDGRRIHLPYVWDYEWEVEPGNSKFGKGDLVLTDGNNDFMVLAGVLGLRLFWCEFALDDDDDADGVADDLSGTDGGLDDDNGFNRFDEDNLLGRRVRMARNNSSLSSGGASAMICCKASTRCNTNCIRKF